MRTRIIIAAFILLALTNTAQTKKDIFSVENYGIKNIGTPITIKFEKGKNHNHPLFAIWLADENGKYIQTLYVSETIGRGVFKKASRENGKWMEGKIQRQAALPYWVHQRNVKNEFGTYNPTEEHPVIDGYTGATPSASFILHTRTGKPLIGNYKIMLELNQCWDWNKYWTNDKYPTDIDYKTSGQPAIVYSTDIDTRNLKKQYNMRPIGHSQYAGANGTLNSDLSTITTALRIAKRITVKIN